MSWGNRLLLVFIAFAGLMSYMVYRCMQTPVELVTKEYYRDELAYQNVIDGAKKANALSKSVIVFKESDKIVVEFPPEMKNWPLQGSILFYCAANEGRDRTVKLNIVSGGKLEIDNRLLAPGNYTVKITWNSGNSEYYSEQAFIVL
jgi:nitrogen fixation protein FixH